MNKTSQSRTEPPETQFFEFVYFLSQLAGLSQVPNYREQSVLPKGLI